MLSRLSIAEPHLEVSQVLKKPVSVIIDFSFGVLLFLVFSYEVSDYKFSDYHCSLKLVIFGREMSSN